MDGTTEPLDDIRSREGLGSLAVSWGIHFVETDLTTDLQLLTPWLDSDTDSRFGLWGATFTEINTDAQEIYLLESGVYSVTFQVRMVNLTDAVTGGVVRLSIPWDGADIIFKQPVVETSNLGVPVYEVTVFGSIRTFLWDHNNSGPITLKAQTIGAAAGVVDGWITICS